MLTIDRIEEMLEDAHALFNTVQEQDRALEKAGWKADPDYYAKHQSHRYHLTELRDRIAALRELIGWRKLPQNHTTVLAKPELHDVSEGGH